MTSTIKTQEDSLTEAGKQLRPHTKLDAFYDDEAQRRERLRSGFNATAKYYDRINALVSLGSDTSYRRRALRIANLSQGMAVLDAGCGTGVTAGLARQIVGPTGFVVGMDPSDEMLGVARGKDRVDHAVQGSADYLPFEDDQFDFVTMTFALRHVADLAATFREYRRVLKPEGKLLILEISTPSTGWRYHLLRFHMKRVVPIFAFLCARRKTARWLYDYCWASHEFCVRPETIEEALSVAGFRDVDRRVELNIFSAYSAIG